MATTNYQIYFFANRTGQRSNGFRDDGPWVATNPSRIDGKNKPETKEEWTTFFVIHNACMLFLGAPGILIGMLSFRHKIKNYRYWYVVVIRRWRYWVMVVWGVKVGVGV